MRTKIVQILAWAAITVQVLLLYRFFVMGLGWGGFWYLANMGQAARWHAIPGSSAIGSVPALPRGRSWSCQELASWRAVTRDRTVSLSGARTSQAVLPLVQPAA